MTNYNYKNSIYKTIRMSVIRRGKPRTSSTKVTNTGQPKLPIEEQEPLKHLMAKHNREDRQHLIQPITAA